MKPIMLIDPADIHSAADTWSGFIYQGKIALYHVLKLLEEDPDIDNLSLQLDSLEDFAIVRYNIDDEIIPVTLHQVKAVKSQKYSRYAEDFRKLEKRKKDFPCDKEAYFHLASQNELSAADIELKHPTLKIYLYDADSYCSLDEVQEKINIRIARCLHKVGMGINAHNEQYIINVSNILEDVITSQIIAVHANNHERNGFKINEGAYLFTIPLNNFNDILRSDVGSRIYDKVYYRKLLKTDLNRYYQEYCVENEEDLSDEVKDKLAVYLIYFNGLDDASFDRFLQSIMPEKIVNFSNLRQYKEKSLYHEGFKNAFIYTLGEIRDSDKDTMNKMGWICKNNKRYFPSAIYVPDTEKTRKDICNKIIETAIANSVSVPFNSDYIITEACNVGSIEKEASNIYNVADPRHDKITSWRNLGLIDVEKAKKELNG